MVVVASFSKVCVFSETDPSTRQRYHYDIVFKSFHFWRPFSKLIVFTENENPTPRAVGTCESPGVAKGGRGGQAWNWLIHKTLALESEGEIFCLLAYEHASMNALRRVNISGRTVRCRLSEGECVISLRNLSRLSYKTKTSYFRMIRCSWAVRQFNSAKKNSWDHVPFSKSPIARWSNKS